MSHNTDLESADTTAGISAQPSLFPELPKSHAEMYAEDAARRALDELFSLARHYHTGKAYHDLIRFITRFHFYAPFNAMLLHVQMPGATFAAPAGRWLRDYGRRIKPNARPLVILQTMGPVMFVFDVSDTEALENAPPLPREVTDPFAVRQGHENGELVSVVENAVRDGVRVMRREAGSASAGCIQTSAGGQWLQYPSKLHPKPEYVQVPLLFDVLLNKGLSREASYATLVHELAHLYCGHLGTPNPKWWPDRRGLDESVREFEAESVCYLVCQRLGIDNPSEEYLAGYVKAHEETPQISLECVMKSAGLIERMGKTRLLPRKPDGR